MEQLQTQEQEISLTKFKELTYHKRVYFFFKGYKDGKIKEFKADKYYCNKYKGILSMPKFILSDTARFFKIDENTFKAVSEFGETTFKVLSEGVNNGNRD